LFFVRCRCSASFKPEIKDFQTGRHQTTDN
jgi:hypothetical protein